ncbi:transcriptional regulator [Halegenticoccus tardaugens]|uniref:transcriptional regulator n=1 Tax=Halegenticoccus tardaugens TaxID=2071624 RepID=UPI00100B8083|nr:transcriptional regulator [Halegenticoccus tardaugens]
MSNKLVNAFRAVSQHRVVVALRGHSAESEAAVQRPDDGLVSIEEAVVEEELIRSTLPTLVERGVVDWDHETDTVSAGPTFEEIQPLWDGSSQSRDEPSDE